MALSAQRLGGRRALWAIVVLALVIRVLLVLLTPHFTPQTDAEDYSRMALSLAATGHFPPSEVTAVGGPTAFRGPVYCYLLAGAFKLVGLHSSVRTLLDAGRLEEAILGAIAVALVILIAQRLWGRTVAVVAGLLAAIYPPMLLAGSSLLSESAFIPLVLGAVLCGLRFPEGRRLRWALLCGVLIGLSGLTRPDGLFLVLPLGCMVWLSPGPRWSRRALAAPALLVGALVLTVLPWLIRDAVVFHSFVPLSTQGGYAVAGVYGSFDQGLKLWPALWRPEIPALNALVAAHSPLNEAQISSHLDHLALTYIGHHPLSLPRTVYWNGVRMLGLEGTGIERYFARFEAYPPTLAVISVWGFWLAGLVGFGGLLLARRLGAGDLRRLAHSAGWAFWLCPLILFASNLPVIGLERYRLPSDPFLVMLAALVIVELVRHAGWIGREETQVTPTSG